MHRPSLFEFVLPDFAATLSRTLHGREPKDTSMRFHMRTSLFPALGLMGLWLSAGTPATAEVCGSFELIVSPTAAGQTSLLTAATAIASDDVWAVGVAVSSFDGVALHWNGTSWSQTTVPDPGRENDLRGVAAFSPSDVWAVGAQNPPAGSARAWVIHWDGTHWSVDAGPPGLEAGAFLWSARTVGADLWAVGSKVVGAPGPLGGTLAARRRGGSWQVFPTPNIADRTNEFLDVDGAGPNDIWGVGDGRSVSGLYRILLAHWDGSTWSNVSVPSPGANDFLRGVTAVSSDDVWAAGEWYDMTEGTQPLLLHWNGSSWTRHVLPVFPEGAAYFEDIFARSADDIWAVGTHATSGGVPRPLILHWDGVAWTQIPGAPGLGYEWFRGVTAAGSCDAWAVGQYFDHAQTGTLTERLFARSTAGVSLEDLSDRLRLRVDPNPTLEGAELSFMLPARSDVEVFVVDASGRTLRRMAAGSRDSGPVTLFWDGRDAGGARVAPGVYFLRVDTGMETRSAKLLVR